jgi:hypothetical protein
MKKVKYLALVLLLVLGLIGGAYAAWSETIDISGRVVTGYIDPVFSAIDHPVWGDSWAYSHPEGAGRVDYTKQFLIDNYSYDEDFQIRASGKELRVRLFNTFPDLLVRKFFTITNNGTAPIKIVDFELNGTPLNLSEANAIVVDAAELRISLSDANTPWGITPVDLIIGAGQSDEFFISVHTLPTATQSSTLDYTLGIVWEIANPADLP